MTKDMTQGSPLRLIMAFAIPMCFGMLFQQFYNMVDTIIVGQFLGVKPLAGVGSTGSLNFMVIGFCTITALEIISSCGIIPILRIGSGRNCPGSLLTMLRI